MKILVITNLFPNNKEPGRGVFNKQQFLSLSKYCEVKVVAPVAWLSKSVKETEIIDGLEVFHPKLFAVPFITRLINGFLFYFGIKKLVLEIQKNFDFDVILVTWAYPDAFAASLLSSSIKKPLIVKVHGTDINVLSRSFLKRLMIKIALKKAEKIVSVSNNLKERMVSFGVDEDKIVLVQNGVDKDKFKSIDKIECMERLGLDKEKKYVLYVGNLVPIKGVSSLINAFKDVDKNAELNIIGDGVLLSVLKQKVESLGLKNRINFVGRVNHEEIPYWMNSSDVLCLPSINEGCPNVVLESLACGLRVAVSKVGSNPDIIDSKDKGILFESRDMGGISKAINTILKENIKFDSYSILSWDENARKVYELIEMVKI